MNSNLWKGIALMIGTWTLFSFMSALVKYSYTYTTAPVAYFFLNFGGFLTLIPYFLSGKGGWLGGGVWGLIGLRSVIGGFSFFALFVSLTSIPLTDGTLLNNTAPLFVPFFAALFLGTPLRLPICLSAMAGFAGVVLILKPTGGVLCLEAIPALLSGVGSASVMIILRLLTEQNPKRILFYYLLLSSIGVAPFAIPQLINLPAIVWPALVCVGLLFGLGQFLYTLSFRYAEPTVLAPFTYTFVVVSGLIDWVVWGHAPGVSSALGIALVLAGGILTIRYSQKKVESVAQLDA
jgi:drug/metabolite transporter (DMT)-like permease